LYKTHEEDIVTSSDDPSERKERLNELYQQLEEHYFTVLKRLA